MSETQLLIDLAAPAELFSTNDDEAYAVLPINGHKENWPVRSSQFHRWLLGRYFQQYRSAPRAQARRDAIDTIEARATYEGTPTDVFTRVAVSDGHIYIDLGRPDWKCVEITPSGWNVIQESPIRFRRAAGLSALPCPVHGGRVDELRPLINLGKEESNWYLLISWLLGALRPTGPYPILIFHAEQGAGKSFATRLCRNLVDPSQAPLRTAPGGVRDLLITARNSWIICADNLSDLSQATSDALCRMATGGGYSTRKLYTDREEVIFDAMRPIILNGIPDLATRQDLADRSLILHLPPIPDTSRKSEAELWQQVEMAGPRVTGALYDALSGALRDLPNVHVSGKPRMADFALWVTAASKTLGWPANAFLDAYETNRREVAETAIEYDPVAAAVRSMIDRHKKWSGTATELLGVLEAFVPERTRSSSLWPRNARSLSVALKRASAFLRAARIEIESTREAHSGRRLTHLRRIPN
jgi:hypothetical protein